MPLSLNCHLPPPVTLNKPNLQRTKSFSPSSSISSLWKKPSFRGTKIKAFFFDEPLLKEALKEPVAFMGGMFAGILRLDLNEDPLKEWVTRTVEASGVADEEVDADISSSEEEIPQQIVIE